MNRPTRSSFDPRLSLPLLPPLVLPPPLPGPRSTVASEPGSPFWWWLVLGPESAATWLDFAIAR
jgi:hypothetical protein